MKDYKEMAQSVLNRRDDYLTKKVKRHTIMMRTMVPMACVVLVVTLVFVISQQSIPEVAIIDKNSSVTSQPIDSSASSDSSLIYGSNTPSSFVQSDLQVDHTSSSTSSPSTSEPSNSTPNNGSPVVNEQLESIIWVPDIPDLNESRPTSPSESSSDSAVIHPSDTENSTNPTLPEFDENPKDDAMLPEASLPTLKPSYSVLFSFEEYENWLYTGKADSFIADSVKPAECDENWVYFWLNADMTLKTGYYYRPSIDSHNPLLSYTSIRVDGQSACAYTSYVYTLKGSGNTFTIKAPQYAEDRLDSQTDIEDNYDYYFEQADAGYFNVYYEITNQIQYTVFVDESTMNPTIIFWQQNGILYQAIYQDPSVSFQSILPYLVMEKAPFRPDTKG